MGLIFHIRVARLSTQGQNGHTIILCVYDMQYDTLLEGDGILHTLSFQQLFPIY